MKKLFSLAATTFFAATAISLAGPNDKDALIKTEKEVWQTVQDKKSDAFRKYLADDFRGVYSDGIHNLDKEVASIKNADLKSFSLGEIDVVFIDKDAALLTYKATSQGTQDGKDVSGTYNCASVWKKIGKDWRVAYHTDVKAE
jgi:hypothetical protein